MNLAAHDHPERIQIRTARKNIENDFKTGVINKERYLMEMQLMDDGERYLNARMPRTQ